MPDKSLSLERFSPAKVNLFLAITGLRNDGFHKLVSLVAPLTFGDTLRVAYAEKRGADTLRCTFPEVPTGPENLVLRAAMAFRQQVNVPGHFCFDLDKRVPAGAGLGGGSSNAASALLAMNELLGDPLSEGDLCALSATLGSDCPLFIGGKATVMSGRGEILEPLPVNALEALSGQRLVLFRPDFGVSTAWAYGTMKAAQGKMYLSETEARRQLNAWIENPVWDQLPLFNNMQEAVFQKHLALPAILGQLREEYGIRCMMSGSGSCCFALPPAELPSAPLEQSIRASLGENCFFAETTLA